MRLDSESYAFPLVIRLLVTRRTLTVVSILEADSQSPIANVRAILRRKWDQTSEHLDVDYWVFPETSRDGKAETVLALPYGEYHAEFSTDDTAGESESLRFVNQEVLTFDIRVSKARQLGGKLLTAEGQPVRNALVTIRSYSVKSGSNQTFSQEDVWTNDNGEFSGRLFSDGPVDVFASGAGFSDEVAELGFLTKIGGAIKHEMRVHRKRETRPLRGKVETETGDPIPNANIVVARAREWPQPNAQWRAISGAKGEYEVLLETDQDHLVFVDATNYESEQWSPVSTKSHETLKMVLKPRKK